MVFSSNKETLSQRGNDFYVKHKPLGLTEKGRINQTIKSPREKLTCTLDARIPAMVAFHLKLERSYFRTNRRKD